MLITLGHCLRTLPAQDPPTSQAPGSRAPTPESREEDPAQSRTTFSELSAETLALVASYARDEKNGWHSAVPLAERLVEMKAHDGPQAARVATRRVVGQMVAQDPGCLHDAAASPHAHLLDEALACQAVRRDPEALGHLPEALRTPAVWRTVMGQTPDALHTADATPVMFNAYIEALTKALDGESAATFTSSLATRTTRIHEAAVRLGAWQCGARATHLNTLCQRLCDLEGLPAQQPQLERTLLLRRHLLRELLQLRQSGAHASQHETRLGDLENEWAGAAVQEGPPEQRQRRLDLLAMGHQALHESGALTPEDVQWVIHNMDNPNDLAIRKDSKSAAAETHRRELQLALREARLSGYCRSLPPQARAERAHMLCAIDTLDEQAHYREAQLLLLAPSLRALYEAMSPDERQAETVRLCLLTGPGDAIGADRRTVLAIAREELARFPVPAGAGVGAAD